MRRRPLTLSALSLLFLSAAAQSSVPDPLICEDTIDGKPPFQSIDIPCIVGCDCTIFHATLSFLPGSINTTCIPYCNLDCVRKDPTPAQSALAPDCWNRYKVQNNFLPENVGWCMYWCVDGYTDLVTSTKCIPSLSYGAPTTSVFDGITVTLAPFTNPPEWQSWYQTQTVIPKTGNLATQPPTTSSAAPRSTQTDLSTISISPSTTTSASRTSSAAAAGGTAAADSASAGNTGKAVSLSRADPLLFAALTFALYLGARVVWY